MPSTKEFLHFVLDQLSDLEGVSVTAMMGEYLIRYRGKVIGGIYDDRFLVKPTASAKRLMPDAASDVPYPGAKEMLAADIDDRDLMNRLIPAIADDLPEPKKRK